MLVVDYSQILLEALTTKCNKSEDISNASQIIEGFLTIYVKTVNLEDKTLGIIVTVFVAVVVQADIIVFMLASI